MTDMPLNDGYITDDSVAKANFAHYKSLDPFPEIPPALLNSADIHDYVLATGMISPYDPSQLKSASYEIKFNEGDLILWRQDTNEKEVRTLAHPGDFYELEKNSIAFINLKTKFRLPDYIGLRFNLQIQLVHSGLLLGTGPLVDPGFVGNLLIPVHNLTANTYRFEGSDGFIWVEFTKVSPNHKWKGDQSLGKNGQYVPFPERKINKSSDYYFERAHKNNPIQSSIPGEVKEAKSMAKTADDTAKKTKKRLDDIVKTFGWGTFFAVLITIIFGVYPLISLVQDAVNYVKGAQTEVSQKLNDLKSLQKELTELKDDLQAIDNNKRKGSVQQNSNRGKTGVSRKTSEEKREQSARSATKASTPQDAGISR